MQDSGLATFRRVFIEVQDGLREPLACLSRTDAIGLDVEMGQRIKRLPGGITSGEQILALIQMAGRDLSIAVDPFRVRDLLVLKPLMLSSTVKVVLGGATDIQLLHDHGVPVENVVDLAEIAVSVFGHKEEGMRALASRALGLEIDKSIRREDWLRRPVNPVMLNYAHRDAELTLRLYRWFQEHHPDAVHAHTRKHYLPELSPDIAPWIRKYLSKRLDAVRLLGDEGINQEAESDRLVDDVRRAREYDLGPGRQRRLLRLIGELRLSALYDDVAPYTVSPSSVFRSAAARTLGRLGDERARPQLEKLLEDEIVDVRSAAQLGLRDLNQGAPDAPSLTLEPESVPSLKPEGIAALKLLRESITNAEE